MRKIILFLKSESFVFISVLCVLTGQVIHTLSLIEQIRRIDLSFTYNGTSFTFLNWGHAFICALAVEAAILMFLINGKKIPAQIYALASFGTNILYYHYWAGTMDQIISSTLVSAMLSESIWFFSDLFAEKIKNVDYTEERIKDYIGKAKESLESNNIISFSMTDKTKDYVGKKGL